MFTENNAEVLCKEVFVHFWTLENSHVQNNFFFWVQMEIGHPGADDLLS